MARGKRPVTFRTRKLSLSAPMVLPWRRGGRVGRRRTYFSKRGSEPRAPAPVLGLSGNSNVHSRRVRRRSMRYPDVMTAPRGGSGGSPSRRGGPQGGGARGGARGGSGGTGGTSRGGASRGALSSRGGATGRSEPRTGRSGGAGRSDRGSSGDRPQRPAGGSRGRPESGAGVDRRAASSGGERGD